MNVYSNRCTISNLSSTEGRMAETSCKNIFLYFGTFYSHLYVHVCIKNGASNIVDLLFSMN